ncbi:proline-rich transmembrane protein 4 isoform X1 [Gadus morhua]|nr:proline-rich transmembrane protein 4 isoform X1 [Gadus morhua]XP_030197176.1 proline-rich transmembrane protein 4 isoform X1 [Gadus morhua]
MPVTIRLPPASGPRRRPPRPQAPRGPRRRPPRPRAPRGPRRPRSAGSRATAASSRPPTRLAAAAAAARPGARRSPPVRGGRAPPPADPASARDPRRPEDPPATSEPPGPPATASSAVATETDLSAGVTPDTVQGGAWPQGSLTPPPTPGTTPLTTSKTPSGGSAGAGGGGPVSPSGAPPSAATEERSTAGSSPTSGGREVASPVPGETPSSEDTNDEEDDEESVVAGNRTKSTSSAAEVSTAAFQPPPTPGRLTTAGTKHPPPPTEAWTPPPADPAASLLPDCNASEDGSGLCDFSYTWESRALADAPRPASSPATPTTPSSNQSHEPFVPLNPAMLVPLYTDWNSAMATWGPAWHAHVYSAGLFFAAVALSSALNLLCLPLRCPSGCGYFALVSVFLLAAGATRSFSLLYDAYGHHGSLPSAEAAVLLQEALFPCLTAAFGLVFLLLSMRSRMQLSYSAFQRPFFLACLVALHFAAAFGPATLLHLYRGSPSVRLFLCLLSRGAFVALAAFLSAAYFVFYVYVRADSKHIYHLNNTSPTPAERYNRCPFAESREWDRAAVTVCVSALFCLGCAGLQLYAMLSAMGVAGGEELFRAWPWWTFQFSCRVCELGVCITLALVVAQPIYCSSGLPGAGSCWTELLAAKSPLLPGTYHWTLSQQEKLAMRETGLGLGETESLPLYSLVDERLGGSLNGLDLLYHSNRALAYRDLDLTGSEKPDGVAGGAASGRSSVTSDSTADLRPPSPIDLRRSIDEALFGESLFPMSLFSPGTPLGCSDLSLAILGPLPNGGHSLFGRDPLSADAGPYRTSSSCAEVPAEPTSRSRGVTATTATAAPPSPSLSVSTSCSSPERWRGSSSSCASYRPSFGGSSLVLCPSPDGRAVARFGEDAADRQAQHGAGRPGGGDPQRRYQTLGSASQESLAMDLSSEADRSLQDEFISVCRQMDASSVCSETIDL